MDVEGVEGDTAVDWTRVKVDVSRQEQENSYERTGSWRNRTAE